ncbi:MAG TPA: hypothetical protein VFZ53_28405, partial [Polyangiaceae bacterium]
QYDDGNWNKVERSAPSTRDLDRSAQQRERGQKQTARNRPAPSQSPSFGGGGGGGRRGGGGGGRRR